MLGSSRHLTTSLKSIEHSDRCATTSGKKSDRHRSRYSNTMGSLNRNLILKISHYY